jgi:PTS system galactitol-specific IIA component
MHSSNTAETPAIDEYLILPGLRAATPAEAIRTLSERLLEAGYVTEGFAEAVIARERTFPTGLPTPIPVALPHTDAQHCRRPAIAVGLLADSVRFGVMGTPDQVIPVQVVFLLVVTDPKQQVRWLKQLVEFFQQPQYIRQIQAAASPSDVATILRGHLLLEEIANARKEVSI